MSATPPGAVRPFDPAALGLAGSWVVVAGASKGIGAAIAEQFVLCGANVVMLARGADELERLAGELRTQCTPDQTVLTRTVDVSSPDAIAAMFEWLDDAVPLLDVFVANAGTGWMSDLLDLKLEDWNAILALNLTGVMLCCQGAARLMARRSEGDRAILVVSSVRALQATPGRLAYSVSKAAANQLVRAAAADLAPRGIRVNGLSPGITETPLTQEHPAAFDEAVAKVPMGRAAQPEDMAAAAVFLCSPASRFTTGTNLVIDGGESLPR